MINLKKRLGALALAGWMTLSLAACGVPLGDAEVRTGEDGSLVIDGEAIWDETAPDGDAASPETTDPAEDAAPAEDTESLYEYYSTREELLNGIQAGYVFRLDHTFEEEARPTVTGGHWPFHSPEGEAVYEYAATGAELEADTDVQETIPLTPGEWDPEVSFVFRSAGGDTPAALHISARCQNMTQADQTYLEELRLR